MLVLKIFYFLILPCSCVAYFDYFYKLYASYFTCRLNTNWMGKLENGFRERVFGQHLATHTVMGLIKSHYQDPRLRRHALSLIFAGPTGTGKNLVSSIIAQSIFGDINHRHVHLFSGRLHFPKDSEIERYQNDLRVWIKGNVSLCPETIFIFDEIDKLPAGLIDAVSPFLDYRENVGQEDYRHAAFIFLTNWGGKEITAELSRLLMSGLFRHETEYKHFHSVLQGALFNEGTFKGAHSISAHLLSGYVPFLPLEMEQIKKCIFYELHQHGLDDSNVEAVVEELDLHDKFSSTGCRRISDIVKRIKYQQKFEL